MMANNSADKLSRWAAIIIGTICLVVLLLFDGSAKYQCQAAGHANQPSVGSSSTIEPDTQLMADNMLAQDMEKSKSSKGLIVVQRIATGEITTIASQQGDNNRKCFDGRAEAFRAWEPGSVMKPLTVTAALNERKLSLNDTFYNPGQVRIGDDLIVNAPNIPKDHYTFQRVITKSINLGAVEALKRLSDRGQIDAQSRQTWHHYLTDIYKFGQPTGAFKFEQSGYVPGLHGPLSTNARFAQTSFGIGLTATPVQLTTAYAMLLNKGVYVAPTLQKAAPETGEKQSVIAPDVSQTAKQMLQAATAVNNYEAVHEGYEVGGKSGTAPSADQTGTYQYREGIGSYIGFVGKTSPEYIVLVKLDEPKTDDVFASSVAARLWASFVSQLIVSGQIGRLEH